MRLRSTSNYYAAASSPADWITPAPAWTIPLRSLRVLFLPALIFTALNAFGAADDHFYTTKVFRAAHELKLPERAILPLPNYELFDRTLFMVELACRTEIRKLEKADSANNLYSQLLQSYHLAAGKRSLDFLCDTTGGNVTLVPGKLIKREGNGTKHLTYIEDEQITVTLRPDLTVSGYSIKYEKNGTEYEQVEYIQNGRVVRYYGETEKFHVIWMSNDRTYTLNIAALDDSFAFQNSGSDKTGYTKALRLSNLEEGEAYITEEFRPRGRKICRIEIDGVLSVTERPDCL